MCQNGNNYNCRLIAKDKVGMEMSFERYTQSTKYNCTTAEGGSQGQNNGMGNLVNYKE